MNADLERDLLGADDGLRDFVSSLRRAPQARVEDGFASRVLARLPRQGGFVRVRSRWLSPPALVAAAASIAAVCAFTVFIFRSEAPVPATQQVAHRQADGSPAPAVQDVTIARLAACQRADGSFSDSSAAPYVQAFAVTALAKDPSSDRTVLGHAVDALVRAQDVAGGWGNNALSARNVAALAAADAAGVERARSAYRRGLRYLRTHGIVEMSTASLAREAKDASLRLGPSADEGMACSMALASRL